MTFKLSRSELLRLPAEEQVDRHYAMLIASEIGSLGILYALKRSQAVTGVGPLLDNDAEAILARSAEQDARLAELDKARRAMKTAIRASTTAAEIQAILATL